MFSSCLHVHSRGMEVPFSRSQAYIPRTCIIFFLAHYIGNMLPFGKHHSETFLSLCLDRINTHENTLLSLLIWADLSTLSVIVFCHPAFPNRVAQKRDKCLRASLRGSEENYPELDRQHKALSIYHTLSVHLHIVQV